MYDSHNLIGLLCCQNNYIWLIFIIRLFMLLLILLLASIRIHVVAQLCFKHIYLNVNDSQLEVQS